MRASFNTMATTVCALVVAMTMLPAITPDGTTPFAEANGVNCSLGNGNSTWCNMYSNQCWYKSQERLCTPHQNCSMGHGNATWCNWYNSSCWYNATSMHCLPQCSRANSNWQMCENWAHCWWNQNMSKCMPRNSGGHHPPSAPVNCSMGHGNATWCNWYNSSCWYNASSMHCLPQCSRGNGNMQWCDMYAHCWYDRDNSKCMPRNHNPSPPSSGVNCSMGHGNATWCNWYSNQCWYNATSMHCLPQCSRADSNWQMCENWAHCWWNQNMSKCMPRNHNNPPSGDCSSYNGKALMCGMQSACWWSSLTGMCLSKQVTGCAAYSMNSTACQMMWRQCQWNMNKCVARPPPDNNNQTLPPAPQCDSISDLGVCAEMAGCYVRNESTWNGNFVAKCDVKPCFLFPAAACPMGRCMKDGGRCLPPPCWNNTRYTCMKRDGACMWKDYSMLNRSACVPTRCDAMNGHMRACYASPNCKWSDLSKKCYELPCTDHENCYSRLCKMSSTGKCERKTCWDYDYDSCPLNNGCSINSRGSCDRAQCNEISNDQVCGLRSDCMWHEMSCTRKPCTLITDRLTCAASMCIFGSDNRCHYPSCMMAQNNSAWCKTLPACWWDADSSDCMYRTCKNIAEPAACNEPCRFNRHIKSCEDVPCHNYTKDSCPKYSGRCAWQSVGTSGACVDPWCTRGKMNQSWCDMHSDKCVFLGAFGCQSQALPRALPCAAGDAESCGMMMPADRCELTSINTATGGSKQVCVNQVAKAAPGTMVKKCFEFALGEKCPSYCQNNWGICINPRCAVMNANQATEGACKNATCRYTSGGNCVDPREDLYPCRAFNGPLVSRCPRGRCMMKNEHCMDASASTDSGSSTDATDDSSSSMKCSDIADIGRCTAMSHCWYNQSADECIPKPCMGYTNSSTCPSKMCKWINGACSKPHCSASDPFYCYNTGTCARDRSMCTAGCPTTMHLCWNSECKNSFFDCKCPPNSPVRCEETKRCVSEASECEQSCPAGSVRCWNNKCAETLKDCDCPTARSVKCNVGGKTWCTADATDCEMTKCPSENSYRCLDGGCAPNELSCSCPITKPHRCLSDRMCAEGPQQCACKSSTQMRCGKEQHYRCVDDLADCQAATPEPTTATCTDRQVQCPDGTCAATKFGCLECANKDEAIPSIEIFSTDSYFDVAQWLRLKANVNYTVCGIDASVNLAVNWLVYNPATGNKIVLPTDSRTNGAAVAIPPKVLQVNTRYAFIATVKVGEFTASSSVKLTGWARRPQINILGGDRSINAGQTLGLAAVVKDDLATTTSLFGGFTWVCTKDNGLADCPQSFSIFETAMAKGVAVPDVPAGDYTITAFYKGVNDTVMIKVSDVPVPAVRIIQLSQTQYAGEDLKLYAIASFTNMTYVRWYWNTMGQSPQLVTGSGGKRVVSIPIAMNMAGTPMKITCRAYTRAGYQGDFGTSSIVITPIAKPTGTCSVSIADGSSAATAFATKLKITASGLSTTEDIKFRFGYMQKDPNGNDITTTLSPFWQDVSSWSTVAPQIRGAIAGQATPVVFVIGVKRDGSDKVHHIKCANFNINGAAVTKLREEARTKVVELSKATESGDTATGVRAAATAATALAEVDDETRMEEGPKVVAGLETVVRQGANTLSSEERGEAVRAVQNVIAATEKNAVEAREFLKENAGKILNLLKNILSKKSDGAIDVTTEGPATLEVLSKARIEGNNTQNRDVAKQINELSRKFARAAALGAESIVRRADVTMAGIQRNALDLGGRNWGTENGTCKFPDSFILKNRNASNTVQLSAVQYDENPVGETGKPDKTTLVGKIADYHVGVDDEDEKIEDLDESLEITFKLSREEWQRSNASSKYMCRYWDAINEMWSTKGVNFTRYDYATWTVYCACNHLSTFGVYESNEPSGDSTQTTTAVSTTNGGGAVTTTTMSTTAMSTTANNNGGVSTTANGNGGQSTTAATTTTAVTTTSVTTTPQTTAPGQTTTVAIGNNTGGSALDSSDDETTMGIIIGCSVGGVILIGVIALICIRSMSSDKGTGQDDEMEMGQSMLHAPSRHTV